MISTQHAIGDMESSNAGKPVALLVTEDGASARVGLALKSEGYLVLEAKPGKQAVDSLERYRPDVALVQMGMDKMDGASACRLVRTFSSAPLLAVASPSGAREDETEAVLNAGADSVIDRPWLEGELRARVRALLRLAKRNQMPTTRPVVVVA